MITSLNFAMIVLASIGFYYAGEQDLRTRTIKSAPAILLYLIASTLAFLNPSSLIGTSVLIVFTFCFIANQQYKERTRFMGWGDAILFPVFVGLLTFMFPSVYGLYLCALPFMGTDLHKRIFKNDKNVGSPLMFYCAIVFISSVFYLFAVG